MHVYPYRIWCNGYTPLAISAAALSALTLTLLNYTCTLSFLNFYLDYFQKKPTTDDDTPSEDDDGTGADDAVWSECDEPSWQDDGTRPANDGTSAAGGGTSSEDANDDGRTNDAERHEPGRRILSLVA
jgi:hypothetical protein